MRTRRRLDSNNIGAFYQFIHSSLMLLFSMQIFGVFPPFSLDLCPGKQKKKERIHGQSGKKVSQPPSCFRQANSTSCGTGKGSSCGCWDSSMHRVPGAISWQWLRKGPAPAAACRGQDCACLQQVANVPTETSHLKLGKTQLYWPSPQATVLA